MLRPGLIFIDVTQRGSFNWAKPDLHSFLNVPCTTCAALNVPCTPCAAKIPLALRQPFTRLYSTAFSDVARHFPVLIIVRVGHHFVDRSAPFHQHIRRHCDIVTSCRQRKHRVVLPCLNKEHVDGSLGGLCSLIPAPVHQCRKKKLKGRNDP